MTWQYLSPGDLVDVIAPSSKYACSKKKQHDFLAGAQSFIEGLELKFRCPKNIFGDDCLYAHDSQTRARITYEALIAHDSKVVWALRGGYGANIILPLLEKLLPNTNLPNKLLIGFSDITALHAYMIGKYNWAVMHWDVLSRIVNGETNPECIHMFKCAAFGKTKTFNYILEPINSNARNTESIVTKLYGGNLALIESSIGTFWGQRCLQNMGDAIIFLEDVGEANVKLDRMLHHLWQAGVFDYTKAIVFGNFNFSQCGDPVNEQNLLPQTLERFANEITIPVFRVENIGHLPYNKPLPLNTKSVISRNAIDSYIMEVNVK